jgi:hypothetical protein
LPGEARSTGLEPLTTEQKSILPRNKDRSYTNLGVTITPQFLV